MLHRISEREIKLSIDSSAGPALYEYLYNERMLGGLTIVRNEGLRLRDGYFDTRELLLWRTGAYLRIRHEPTRSRVTLRFSRGSALSPDIVECTTAIGEVPRVVDALIRQLPSLGPMPENVSAPRPLFEKVGLQHVVSLRNERRVLFVQPERPAPEYRIKLDKVTYDIWSHVQYEIELDVYDRDGLPWLAEVAHFLLTREPGTVRVTTSTKLDRGLLLRALSSVRL